jgi:predicted nucleic acid-binding protein
MKIFADTSALYAILDEDDLHHVEGAAAFSRLLDLGELVTHNYIHLEAELLVRRRLGPSAVATLVDQLLPSITTVWIDEGTHRAALEAWRAGSGKVSLVDHVSFVVMRRMGIETALAFDADFELHGFPRPPVPIDTNSKRLSEQPAEYGTSLTGESDLVGVAEIAARSGHPTSTVQSWRRRHRDFPPPTAQLATGPVWAWPAVLAWIQTRPARTAEPILPLFTSGRSGLAAAADDLARFGER